MSTDKAQLIALLQQLLAQPDENTALAEVKSDVNALKTQAHELAVAGGKAWTDLDALKTRVGKIETERPVRHVQVNDRPVVELEGRVHPSMPLILKRVGIGLKPVLIGPAGAGKSYLVEQVAKALGLPFHYVNLTQGASETWLFGRQTPTGFSEGPFSLAYRNGGVFLGDELDAADANLLLALNTALEAKVMFNPMNGEQIPRHKDFIFIAAMNTNGLGATVDFTGRSRLDASTLDRLTPMKITYDTDLERQLCPDVAMFDYLTAVRAALSDAVVKEFVSTRVFIKAYDQLAVGISFEDIMESLTMIWSPAARKLAKDLEHVFFDHVDNDAADDAPADPSAPPVKRGRGRPRKYPRPDDVKSAAASAFVTTMTGTK